MNTNDDWSLHVLAPSRGRPRNIARLWRSIDRTARHPERIVLHVRLDDDDETADGYPLQNKDRVWYTVGPRTRLAASWNELAGIAAKAGATHLALWGDDNVPETRWWDEALIGVLRGHGPGWAYGRDGVWDSTYGREIPGHLVLPTATIMSVELYDALGWVAPPGLTHLCVDVAWRDLGIAAGCLFYVPDVCIRHHHRITGAPDDQTYRDANDNLDQVRADNVAISAWKASGRFATDLAKTNTVRDQWRATL